jgi:hypothetical protein
MKDHDGCCGSRHARPVASTRRLRRDDPAIPLAGSISSTVVAYAARVRHRVPEDVVERRARELQAASSYDCWNGLSDRDQELWRHMARLDLTT